MTENSWKVVGNEIKFSKRATYNFQLEKHFLNAEHFQLEIELTKVFKFI